MLQRERLAAGLTSILGATHPDCRVDVTDRATVGLSQETWFVRIEHADGTEEPAVLRLPTPGSGRHAIGTQIRALTVALHHGLPVPRLLSSDESDENPLLGPYLLMERAAGDVPTGWNQVEAPTRMRLAEQAIQLAATLHAVDWRRIPEQDRPGRIVSDPTDRLAGLRRRFNRLPFRAPRGTEAALQWLEANVPPAGRGALVHNDFRMGNFVVANDHITSILDWELADIGDPLEDVTWCFLAIWEPTHLELAPLYAKYEQIVGHSIDPGRIKYFTALGYARCLYYALSGQAAFEQGAMDDLRLAALRYEVPARLENLLRAIDGEGIT